MKQIAPAALAVLFLASATHAQESLPQPPREVPPAMPAQPPAAPAAVPESHLPSYCLDAPPCVNNTRWFLDADYLLWWVKRAPLPAPIITTTRNLGQGLPGEFTGSLDDPGTQPLIDKNDMNYGAFSGLRLRGGYSLEPFTLELGGFLLERRSGGGNVVADNLGFPFIAQTFFDVLANRENSYFVSVPIFSSGAVFVSQQNQFFGAEANLASLLIGGGRSAVSIFAGYRFLGLNEHLNIDQRILSLADPNNPNEVSVFYLGQPVFNGGIITIHDAFRTTNRFHGGQIGAIASWTVLDNLDLTFRGTLGFGVNQELVEISGYTTLQPPMANQITSVTQGGIYAQPSNSGRFFRNVFSFVPEGEVSLQYHFAANWTAKIGYDMLFWSNVVRPGDQFDRHLDRRGVPSDPNYQATPPVPATAPYSFVSTNFWAQGLTFGVEWRF